MSVRTNVVNNGKLHVMREKCETCIFHPGNRMGLEPGRVAGMVKTCKEIGGSIPCHSTIYGAREQEAVCNGFFEAHGDSIDAIQIAKRLDMVKFVDVDEEG